MKTLYDTGDEVLIPATIVNACKLSGEIYYSVSGIDELIPEGLIEGKPKIGKYRYYKQEWENMNS